MVSQSVSRINLLIVTLDIKSMNTMVNNLFMDVAVIQFGIAFISFIKV